MAMVLFVIPHCRNSHVIALHWVTAAEALISSSAVVQEGVLRLVILFITSEQRMAETIKKAV